MIQNSMSNIKAVAFHAINYSKRCMSARVSSRWGISFPNSIYIIPDCSCNSHCSICHSWKIKSVTLPFPTWKACIDDIADNISPYIKINISGGEVLLPGLSKELVVYAVKRLPYTGITTNGYIVDKTLAESLIALGYSNINVSFDGTKPETVVRMRGREDAYEKTSNAIRMLVEAKKHQHARTKIIIKTVIAGPNFQEIPSLVRWVETIGADGIYLQPIQPIFLSGQTLEQLKQTPLWVQDGQRVQAEKVISTLIKMKGTGCHIINDNSNLHSLFRYFELGLTNNETDHRRGCEVDLDSLFIMPDGNVHFCMEFPSIGNIKNQSITDILHLKSTGLQRSQIRQCCKECLTTCFFHKSLIQRITLFLQMLRK